MMNKRKCIYFFAMAFFIILLLLRFNSLDKDLPNFGLNFYQAKDEGTYSLMSLNAYNYKSLTSANGIELTTSPTFRANVVGNVMQYICLQLFGDNYTGFRVSYTIVSVLTIILILNTCIMCSRKNNVKHTWQILILGLYMVLDYNFLVSSRVVENSSVRAFVTALCLYMWVRYEDERKRYFLLGFFSITAVFLVYFSNVHLLAASGIIGLYKLCQSIRRKRLYFLDFMKYWGLGALAGTILSEAYYLTVWKESCWVNLLNSLTSFSDRVMAVESSQSLLTTYSKGFMTFWASNVFFYNFMLAILFVLALIGLGYLFYKLKSETHLLLLGISIMFILQSVFTDDWMERKSISIYPVIVISIYLMYLNKGILNKVVSKNIKRNISILIIGIVPCLMYSMVRIRISRSYYLDFELQDIKVWIISCVAQILILLIILVCWNKNAFRGKKAFCCAVSGLTVVATMNLYFSVKYVYTYDSYSEKEAMIGIGEIAGDSYVAGPYSYGYSLYNSIKPVWNVTTLLQNEIDDGMITYYCDYTNGPYYVNLMKADRDYYLVESFDRNLIAQGTEFPIGLFESK